MRQLPRIQRHGGKRKKVFYLIGREFKVKLPMFIIFFM